MDGDGKLVSFKVVLGGKPLLSWFTVHVSKESITFLEALEILRDASTAVDSTVHLRGEFPKEFPLPRVFVGETLASRRRWSWRFCHRFLFCAPFDHGASTSAFSSRAGSLKVNKEAAEGTSAVLSLHCEPVPNVSMG